MYQNVYQRSTRESQSSCFTIRTVQIFAAGLRTRWRLNSTGTRTWSTSTYFTQRATLREQSALASSAVAPPLLAASTPTTASTPWMATTPVPHTFEFSILIRRVFNMSFMGTGCTGLRNVVLQPDAGQYRRGGSSTRVAAALLVQGPLQRSVIVSQGTGQFGD